MLTADAVFEGGGVKGIGLVGALCALEERGYTWNRTAGTSAGAIIASMVAAGYTGSEMKRIIKEINYKNFINEDGVNKIPGVGKTISILKYKGIYNGNSIEKFIFDILRAKGKITFRDVWENGESKLKIIAADITNREIVVLPDDLQKYGINPQEFTIARAVRMSIGIPFYFQPVELKYGNNLNYIVDGGLLSNFPVWIFDAKGIPRWPTFGFKLIGGKPSHTSTGNRDIISYILDITDTLIDKDEERYIKDKDFIRTIPVHSMGVKTTEFNLSKEKSNILFNSGYTAAVNFIRKWDFQRYIKDYRIK